MSGMEQRMAKLESALTPEQAISLFLDRFLSYQTLGAFWRVEQDLPGIQQSFVRLMRQMREGARQAHPTMKEDALRQVTRRMQRDVAFLFDLITDVNEALQSHRRLRWYQLAVLAGELEAPLRELRGQAKRQAVPHDRAWPIVVELHAQVLAVRLVSERYFGGRDLRVPALAEDQDLLMEQLSGLLASYQECVAIVDVEDAETEEAEPPGGAKRQKMPNPVYPRVDEEGARRRAAQLAASVAAAWIDAAKTSALLFMGETEQASAILRRRLGEAEAKGKEGRGCR